MQLMRRGTLAVVFLIQCLIKITKLQSDMASAVMTPEQCDTVKSKCMGRAGCGMALHNFFIGCNAIIYGETTQCTAQCNRALISLMSTNDDIGLSFINCDCEGDSFCEVRKRRVEVCSTSVLAAIKTLNDSSIVDCSFAYLLCEADASCQTALTAYIQKCDALLEGIACTNHCNNSLAILYRQKKAAKLINCTCEGTESFDCPTIRKNTDTLCFHKWSKYSAKDKNCATDSRSYWSVWFFMPAFVILAMMYRL